jgi:hypothetical protein
MRRGWRAVLAKIILAWIVLSFVSIPFAILLERRGEISASPPPPQGLKSVDFVGLAWAGVAFAAIVAIYKLASKALESDRNVEMAWKVTSKVSGRLVMKKVPVAITRPRRGRGVVQNS